MSKSVRMPIQNQVESDFALEFATHKVAEGILIEGEAVKSDRRVSLPYSPPILPPVDLVSVPRPPSSPASSAHCSGRWRTSGRDADGIAARGGALTLAGGAGAAAGGGGSWVGLGWHAAFVRAHLLRH